MSSFNRQVTAYFIILHHHGGARQEVVFKDNLIYMSQYKKKSSDV